MITRETLRRFLTCKGKGTYTALKKPLLKASDIKRFKLEKERMNWTVKPWGMIILIMNQILRCLKGNQGYVVPTLQGGSGSAGIFRCISSKGTECCRIYDGIGLQHKEKICQILIESMPKRVRACNDVKVKK
ncbi:hypothetical protein BpHYR1_030758 [Brachionus plicatilis]|uniref:Uncharacterized protein n=1 Tax=Brachionus plicatilis TaxID=10195 RepID=A0A3M7PHR6_BRAPC|nr:hypothetical protein BpHYR1_030758 [Brachionus plicatilis]